MNEPPSGEGQPFQTQACDQEAATGMQRPGPTRGGHGREGEPRTPTRSSRHHDEWGGGSWGRSALPRRPLPLFAMTDASPVSERLTLSISLLGLQAAGAAGQHGASGTQHRELEGVALTGSGPASPPGREPPVPSPPKSSAPCWSMWPGLCGAACGPDGPRPPRGHRAGGQGLGSDVTEQTTSQTSAWGQRCGR